MEESLRPHEALLGLEAPGDEDAVLAGRAEGPGRDRSSRRLIITLIRRRRMIILGRNKYNESSQKAWCPG